VRDWRRLAPSETAFCDSREGVSCCAGMGYGLRVRGRDFVVWRGARRGTGKDAYNPGVSPEKGKSDELVGRILGLDVGSRRIGIAVSDPLGITAQGLETLQRRNKRHDLAALEQVIRDYAVREIVVGLPLRMSGAEGTQSEKMQVFAEELRKRFRLPVHLWDERLTSAEANRLLRETDLSIEKRAKAVDRMAAVLILQGWMQSRSTR
jgi:putative Holliday junction resolvase